MLLVPGFYQKSAGLCFHFCIIVFGQSLIFTAVTILLCCAGNCVDKWIAMYGTVKPYPPFDIGTSDDFIRLQCTKYGIFSHDECIFTEPSFIISMNL
jgi:hypothetical protein